MTVVKNNCGCGQCHPDIDITYGERAGNREELCKFMQFDFNKIANELGGFGIKVEHPKDISLAVKTAMESDVPAVIEVITDILRHAPESWSPS